MGAALEVLEINHPRANGPRQVRLSRNIKAVIDLMVHDCEKLDDALAKVGITRGAYLKASFKPEFIAYQQEAMRVLRNGEASRTISRAVKLADGAESEHVRLQANTWIAGIEGISPITKSESVNVHKHLIPGLTINFGAISTPGDAALLIGGQVHETESDSAISSLPAPVPHPSMRNAQKTGHPPAQIEAPAAGTRGAKS